MASSAIDNATGITSAEIRINPPGAATAGATNVTESIIYNDTNKVLDVDLLLGSNDTASFPPHEHSDVTVDLASGETHSFTMVPGEAIQFTNTVTGTSAGNVVINAGSARVRHGGASRTFSHYYDRNGNGGAGAVIMSIITT